MNSRLIYADTSVLVAAYLPDGHSAAVWNRLSQGIRLWVTPLHQVEWEHAVAQQLLTRRIAGSHADAARSHFDVDAAQVWTKGDLPELTYATAERLARDHVWKIGGRSLDSLHVASALELGARQFWTLDTRQAKLAKAAGLSLF